jgi:hypothetical protein
LSGKEDQRSTPVSHRDTAAAYVANANPSIPLLLAVISCTVVALQASPRAPPRGAPSPRCCDPNSARAKWAQAPKQGICIRKSVLVGRRRPRVA